MKRVHAVIAFLALLAMLQVAAAFAQVPTGQISGRVTDTSGAVLPGVDVTVTQTSTGQVRSAVSNETGQYVIPSLPLGPYRLEATLQGFRTFVQEGITLQVNANLVVDPQLTLGQLNETITVTARPSDVAVETRSMSVATVVEREEILELPLPARNVTNLIMSAGAAVQVDQSPTWGMATGINIAVAGGQRFGVAYLLGRRRAHQPLRPDGYADALPRFSPGVPREHEHAGGGHGTRHGRLGERRHPRGHQPVPRRPVLVWTPRSLQRAQGRRHSRRRLEAESAGLHLRRAGRVQSPVLLPGVSEHDPRSGAVGHPVDRSDGSDARRRLVGVQSVLRPAWRDTDFADGSVNPSRFSPAALQLAARLPQTQNPCGEVRWGDAIERHDKQFVSRVDFTHTTNHSVFGRYMGTLHDQAVPFSKDPSNLLSTTSSGFNGSPSLADAGQYLGSQLERGELDSRRL